MTVTFDTFTIDRTYDASPARVFSAFADPETKARWFVGPDGWTVIERTSDVRPGGREVLHGRHANGMETKFVATYHEIIRDQRLVYAYDMHVNGVLISVSLATIEVLGEPGGTRLRVTEQGVYVEGGAPAAASRKQGTEWLIDKIGPVVR